MPPGSNPGTSRPFDSSALPVVNQQCCSPLQFAVNLIVMATIWCSHPTREVDRFLCPEPCGAMHVRCTGCGAAVGGCPFESEGLHERLVATLGAQLPCAEEWQVLELVEIVERRGHAERVHTLTKALTESGIAVSC
jgi:hypothetical protein